MMHTPCADCGIDTLPIPPRNQREAHWYMVTDDVWNAAGMDSNGGYLCLDCLENRLGRTLIPTDLARFSINFPGIFDDNPRLYALKTAADIDLFEGHPTLGKVD